MSVPAASTPQWNPADYAQHSAVQLDWGRQLIASVDWQGNERVLDVGCGDGKITAELARMVPHGRVTGVDGSPAMIAYARQRFSHLDFQVQDARSLPCREEFDVVFSNLALHWMDDQAAFFRGAAAALGPGGQLVVASGGRGNGQAMVTAFHRVLRRRPWRNYFRGLPRPYFFYPLRDYAAWLVAAGFTVRQLQLAPLDTAYDGESDLENWLRTAWLPYTQRVPEPFLEAFISAVVNDFLSRHPLDDAGRAWVRLVRLEIAAVKG